MGERIISGPYRSFAKAQKEFSSYSNKRGLRIKKHGFGRFSRFSVVARFK